MYQEFFMQKGVFVLPIVALLSFALSFMAILWWSLRASRQPYYEALAQLPLSGDGETPTAAARAADAAGAPAFSQLPSAATGVGP